MWASIVLWISIKPFVQFFIEPMEGYRLKRMDIHVYVHVWILDQGNLAPLACRRSAGLETIR